MTQTLINRNSIDQTMACPKGFAASGLASGIKPSGADDLALIICPKGANAAAVFTRNLVCAAPITVSKQKLAASKGRVRALIINSGCANAATGEEGVNRTNRVIDALAAKLGAASSEVIMNSTGVIGEHLPDDKIIAALPALIESCSSGADGLTRAATAIHTTDTRLKMTQQTVRVGGRTCRVVGIAKGAGMIHPNMATMIAVMMIDAKCSPASLDTLLRNAVDRSFHRITVDGDTSTNDAAYLLASGEAGEVEAEALAQAVNQVARDLAEMIVRDGEGAAKLIRVRINGARSPADALQVAQTVASSLLVRTSVAGGDPNWGRIICAAGRAGVELDPERITLRVNDLLMFSDGRPSDTPLTKLAAAYASDELIFDLDLHSGNASDEFITCDLTEGYVRVNADYTS